MEQRNMHKAKHKASNIHKLDCSIGQLLARHLLRLPLQRVDLLVQLLEAGQHVVRPAREGLAEGDDFVVPAVTASALSSAQGG